MMARSDRSSDPLLALLTCIRATKTFAITLLVLLAASLASAVVAQDGPTAADEAAANADNEPVQTVKLPRKMADGRPLKAIAVFYEQLVELVPKNYRPVAINRLRDAINHQLAESAMDEKSRLRSSFYDVRLVDDSLICQRDRSEIVIESDQPGIVRRSLGKVNLAIAAKGDAWPQLASSVDGELLAVLPADASRTGLSTINFSWSLRGKVVGMYRDFELQIPRTPETRIVLSTPIEYDVISLAGGVLRPRASIPQGAEPRSQEVHWYEIEAGGLASVHLRTYRRSDSLEANFLAIHRTLLQYEIDSMGIRWSQRMTVQARGGTRLPPLNVSAGIVTAVEIDDRTWKFKSQRDESGLNQILFNERLSGSPSESTIVPVLVQGISPLDTVADWIGLPRAYWTNADVIQTQVTDQVRVGVRDPLSVVTWQLPEGWVKGPSDRNSHRAVGPPVKHPPLAKSGPDSAAKLPGGKPNSPHWSRIRLTNQPAVTSTNTLVQLNVTARTAKSAPRLNAKVRITAKVDPGRVAPIQLQIQPGWVDLVFTLPNSRRVLEQFGRAQSIQIYPEADDIRDGELIIEATGHRLLGGPNPTIIPEIWLVRVQSIAPGQRSGAPTVFNVRGDFVAVIVPPTELNWTGETAMQNDQIGFADLTEQQQTFFGTLPAEALIFRPELEKTPVLSLQTPEVSSDIRTSLRMDRDGSDVVESLAIEARSASQRIKNEFSVETSSPDSLPRYRWSLRGDGDQVPINLPATVVTFKKVADSTTGADANTGIYTINLGERNLRGKRLVGRRQYPLPSQPFKVELPVVSDAASQTGDVLLGAGLTLTDRSAKVDLVPLDRSSLALVNASPAALRNTTRLRYDPNEAPSITVAGSDEDSALSIVWQQDVSITASSRGSDSIEALFRVSSTKPIVINYEPDLQLTALLLNGEDIDVGAVLQRPIVLPPSEGITTVRLLWNRNELESSWIRRCSIPRIEMSGVSVKSSYRLSASDDTFAPATLFRATNEVRENEEGWLEDQLSGIALLSSQNQWITVTPSSIATLVHRNLALACGWLLAALTFIACWLVAHRSALAVGLLIALASTSSWLWQSWQIAIIGWIVLPAAAAALLEASRSWSIARGGTADPASESPSESKKGQSHDFSYSLRTIVFWVGFATLAASELAAQEADTPLRRQPMNVLIPIDADGKPVGDKVYVPGSDYDQLFKQSSNNDPAELTLLSAVYRANLDFSQQSAPEIQADFVIHVDGPTNQVQFPMETRSVRRIELLQGDQTRIILFDRGRQQLSFELPPGDTYELRLTLTPMLRNFANHKRLTMKIPSVSASRLVLEADRNVGKVHVAAVGGNVIADPALRRWEANLGSISNLLINFAATNIAKSDEPTLVRRYWITVGKLITTVSCEIEPASVVFAGDTVQLEIVGADAQVESLESTAPKVISPSWHLSRQTFLSPTRRLIALTKITDSLVPVERGEQIKLPEPIQLLWEVKTRIGESPSETIVPEVLPVGNAKPAPAVVALQHDPQLQTSLASASVTDIDASQFIDQWHGYQMPGPIQRAFVVDQGFRAIEVTRDQATTALSTINHHFHIANRTQCELRFKAVVSAGDSDYQRRTLRMPKAVDLRQIKVNGKSLEASEIDFPGGREIPLGEFDRELPTVIEVTAAMKGKPKIVPPLLELWPPTPSKHQYEVTRGPGIQVTIQGVPQNMTTNPESTILSEQLAAAQIPVVVWQTEVAADSDPRIVPAALKVKDKPRQFGCEQLVALAYDDARWSMQAIVQFAPADIPDFIDVEIPSRWCDSLEITPATTWARRTSTDPSIEVIRVTPRNLVQNALIIRGQLDDSDQGGISVPRVTVLGSGKREFHASVPSRATSEWKRKSHLVVPEPDLPVELRNVVSLTGQRQHYRVSEANLNSTWSIELLPTLDLKTQLIAGDTQVFLRESEALVICRLDLVPGNMNSVAVRLPRDAECLGAWAAQRPVQFTPLTAAMISSSAASPQESSTVPELNRGTLIRVPLSLSRLSQSVELLLSIPMRRARLDDYLPSFYELWSETNDGPTRWSLSSVPLGQQWMAVYSPTELAPPENELVERFRPPAHMNSDHPLDQARAIALAASAIDSIEQSLEILAERPRGEVATWLIPWVGRYRKISESSGRKFDWKAASRDNEAAPPTGADEFSVIGTSSPATEAILTLSVKESWRHLDRRMAMHARRFLSDDTQISEPLFAAGNFAGYTLTEANKIAPGNPARPIHSMSSGMQDLRDFISNVLTLVMVCGLLVLMWPLRQHLNPILMHPASWLGLLGVFAMFVAPVPVAMAIIVIAVTLPLLPVREPSRV